MTIKITENENRIIVSDSSVSFVEYANPHPIHILKKPHALMVLSYGHGHGCAFVNFAPLTRVATVTVWQRLKAVFFVITGKARVYQDDNAHH